MDSFTSGRHEALIETLSTDMAEVKAAITRIELHLAEKKGERRVGLYFAAGGGGLAASVLSLALKRIVGL